MQVIIDEQRVARLRKVSQYISLLGFLLLVGGLIMAFTATDLPNLFLYQMFALFGGWFLSQIGIYLAHRYVRRPRPDEVLNDAVGKSVPNGRMYHYVLPASHVLLTSSGPIIFVAKYQTGNISVDGDKWSQKGIGMGRFFGQQGLGNPTREAENQIKALARFIHENVPGVEEVPIGGIIVFTAKGLKSLDLDDSTIPAMHYTKVRGYLKNKGLGQPLPTEQYQALRQAFDKAAGDLV